ncbi:MAG TPA: type II secretion system secretin GspD [Pseudomonadales bacterium]|nr:type II secretion system secretin GspD [Pseudomonadales bacterium]
MKPTKKYKPVMRALSCSLIAAGSTLFVSSLALAQADQSVAQKLAAFQKAMAAGKPVPATKPVDVAPSQTTAVTAATPDAVTAVAATAPAVVKPAVDPNQKITIAFDNADVKDVIRWAADLTTKNMIVHPGVLGKKITVVAGEPMSRQEAWQVFLSSLQVNGIAVMEGEDTVKILPEPEAKTEKIPVSDDQKKAGKEDVVVRIIKVKNLSANQLITLLKPLTPASAQFAAYPETNTLILADRSGNIDQIADIIRRIDQAGTLDIEIIKLEFASAKDVSKILTDLVGKSAPGGKDAPPSQALNITADERSNSILMTGDPVLRMQLRKLIQKLDQPLAGDGNTQVVYLNYIEAKDLEPILEGVGGGGKSSGGGKDAGGGADHVEVKVQALEQTNAIVITAPPSTLNTMKGVIAKLDVRRKQVMVEALIVEVSEDASRELGIFWGSQAQDSNGMGKFLGSFPGGASTGVPDFTKAAGSGLTLGYLKNGDMRAAMRALETDANANVLSTPTVIALDNEEASILVGESVPFKTGTQNPYSTANVIGGTVGGATTTQSYNNAFVSINREDIGVTLKVTPRINQENILTLQIEQKVESINDSAKVGGDSGASDIITNKREIKTTALVRNDQVLVLGGLMQDDAQDKDSGVPFLRKIPLLGRLFQGTSKSVTKKNLMVFIHPRILEDDQQVSDDAKEYYGLMYEKEQKFNRREMNDGLRIDKPLPGLDAWPHRHGDASTLPSDQAARQPAVVTPVAPPAAVQTVH